MNKFATTLAVVLSLGIVAYSIYMFYPKEKVSQEHIEIVLHLSPNNFVKISVPNNTVEETDNETIYEYATGMKYGVASNGALRVLKNEKPALEFGATSNIQEMGEKFTFYTNWDNKRYRDGIPAMLDVDLSKVGVPTEYEELLGRDTIYFEDGFLRVENVYRNFQDTVNDLSAVMECCYGQEFTSYYNSNDVFYTRQNNYSVGAKYVNSNTTLTIKAKGELAQAMILVLLYGE